MAAATPTRKSEFTDNSEVDVERFAHDTSYLSNDVVESLVWRRITVTVPDRKTKLPKEILSDVNGNVAAGEMMAIMGPSGSGKTTLLNVLAQREASANAQVSSVVLINGQIPSDTTFRRLSSYVESDDALIGSLTVEETLYFTAQLSLSGSVPAVERIRRIKELLRAFGLTNQANTLIGTLLKKGISTGQKRRLSVASQLISAPKILFLDEPTTGLDSAASFRVMSYVQQVAKVNKLIVISSIHQPSTATFGLFDTLLLLSGGKVCYNGSISNVKPYFDNIGFSMPAQMNPAEFVLDLTNVDFDSDVEACQERIAEIQSAWESSATLEEKTRRNINYGGGSLAENDKSPTGRRLLTTIWILLHRSWIKSRRDAVVYGVRFVMYLGLAIMMGTVWLRLPPVQSSIQPYLNCILFGSSFMSFMAVVYVPAFLEDRAVYIKDRANGLYGSTAFIISNFLIGLPYLFVIVFVSSTFVYWMTNFRPTGTAFMTWVMWMYLNLIAAESLVVLMSSLFPHFVAALALTAFANGLWMSCNGFMVTPPLLNPFYRYVFYYIDYQAYVFRGLVVNEFGFRVYACGRGCQCTFDTPLKDQCKIDGAGVLENFGFDTHGEARRVSIVLAIILVLRLLGWMAVKWRR
ncbi:White-brown complex [Hyphodiscus hymeniophilus]|uniref:White-brown complex n=1 Tax=Hyphodiscus hymeniophilus TaxID=353542 RepID=A0A9P6VH05_9HELO|nr:White-brown complex [Hyphodiscus hymeniophilus]